MRLLLGQQPCIPLPAKAGSPLQGVSVDSGEKGTHKQLFEHGFDGLGCASLYYLHFGHRILHLSALASLRSGVLLQVTQGTSLLFGDILL
jgi:hypothetical protein